MWLWTRSSHGRQSIYSQDDSRRAHHEKGQEIICSLRRFQQIFWYNQSKFFYKLLKYGITGNLYKIIKSMYDDPQYSVLVNGAISPKVCSSYGVKQGCSFSPILSNIFQNDIHDIFQDCDPVKIGDVPINSISWADDLLLISCSKEGLQSCLNKLNYYCIRWGLTVNDKKTKAMVFSKSKWSPENFTYDGKTIECVKDFQYLGSTSRTIWKWNLLY